MLRKPIPAIIAIVIAALVTFAAVRLLRESDATPAAHLVASPTADASPSPKPSASPTPGAAPSPPGTPRIVSLALPKVLNGRPMLTDSSSRQASQRWVTSMEQTASYTGAVAASFGTRGKQNQMWVAAAKSNHMFTSSELTDDLEGYATRKFVTKVDTPFAIKAGPLGGYAMCVKLNDGNGSITYPTTVCEWSDEHSYGIVTWYQKTPSQVVREFISIRGQIEHANR